MDAAIVTGVSRGLGEALASALLGGGFTVLGIGRSASARLGGPNFRFARCELGDTAAIPSRVETAMRELAAANPGSVTLINNAAVAGPARIGRIDAAAAASEIAINVAAPAVLASLFCAAFTDERCERRIINISSGAAQNALQGSSLYSISKAAIEMLTKTLVADIESPTFRAISLRPGIFETGMQVKMRSLDPAEFPSVAMFRGFKDNGLLKDPNEVAAAIIETLVRAPVENGRTYVHTDLYPAAQ